jgi:hypothetical protein
MGRRVVDVRLLRMAAFARLWAVGWVTAVDSQLTAVVVPLDGARCHTIRLRDWPQ